MKQTNKIGFFKRQLQNFVIKSMGDMPTDKSITRFTYGPLTRPYTKYEEAFSDTTFALLNRRATAFAQINNYWVDKNNEPLPIEHPLNVLFNRPNPRMNKYQYTYLLQMWIDFWGNGYTFIEGKDPSKPVSLKNMPIEMNIIPSDRVLQEVNNMDKGIIEAYKVVRPGGLPETMAVQWIHFRTYRPSILWNDNLTNGVPALMNAAASAIKADKHLTEYMEEYYKSNAISPYYISFPGQINDDVKNALIAKQNEAYENHKVKGVLSNGAKIEVIPTASDAKNIIGNNLGLLNKKKLCEIFGVPLGLLDTSSQQNKATAEINKITFREQTIEPLLIDYEQTITNWFQDHLGITDKLVHDVYEYTDPDTEVNRLSVYVTVGIMTRNEARQKLKLNKSEDPLADELLISKPPVGSVSPEAAKTAESDKLSNVNPSGTKGLTIKAYNNLSEQDKIAHWNKYINKAIKPEGKLKQAIYKCFTDIQSEVNTNLKAYSTKTGDKEYFNEKKAKKKLSDKTNPIVKTIVIDAMAQASADIGEDFVLSEYEREIIQNTSVSVEKITDSVNTLGENIKEKIKRITEDNPNANDTELNGLIKDGINEQFDDVFNESRIDTISRTTTTVAIGTSQLSVWHDTIWVTQRDRSVRGTHNMMDGKKPEADGYHVGSDIMQSPGTGSEAGENVNCRCILYPDI